MTQKSNLTSKIIMTKHAAWARRYVVLQQVLIQVANGETVTSYDMTGYSDGPTAFQYVWKCLRSSDLPICASRRRIGKISPSLQQEYESFVRLMTHDEVKAFNGSAFVQFTAKASTASKHINIERTKGGLHVR